LSKKWGDVAHATYLHTIGFLKFDMKNKLKIINRSKIYEELTINQKILTILYDNKAFNANDSIILEEILPNIDISMNIEDLLSKNLIFIDENGSYYISKRGKILVNSLYSDLTKKIFEIPE